MGAWYPAPTLHGLSQLSFVSMKFEAPKAVLLDALQMACSAIPNKTTLQVLYNLYFDLKDQTLEIRATDLDMAVVQRLTVEGHRDGALIINARKLLEVVKELPDMPVIFSMEDLVLTIRSESGFQGNLTGYDPSEYPALPEVGETSRQNVPLKDLRFLSEKTGFAVSTDFSRMALTGIYCEFKQDRLEMVATDGHRLGKAIVGLPGLGVRTGVILPTKAVQQVLRMSEDPEQLIEIEIGTAHARFATGAIVLYTKLIEGPYPNYENVIPKQFSKSATVNREHLASVVRRVSTMANAKTRLTVLGFQSGGNLLVSARNQDLGGDSEENLPLAYDGEDLELGANAQYLLEVLRLCHSEEVRLKFNNPLGAIVVEPVAEEAGYFFIVMPLRIVRDAL
jgi:DNA polymerase III subunit beta